MSRRRGGGPELRLTHLVPAIAALAACLAAVAARAAPVDRDLNMEQYLAIWSRNANVTPATVEKLYARDVNYYGRPMSAAAVFRDKLAFVRRWPRRRYDVVPGTVSNDCGGGVARCRVTAVLRWSRGDASGRHAEQGTNTVRLDLVREDGILKIARESGAPVR